MAFDRIVISAANNLLFVTNTLDLDESARCRSIPVRQLDCRAGSPFASGFTLDACQGISLAATPGWQIPDGPATPDQTFSICRQASPSLAATTPNCCTPMVSMKDFAQPAYFWRLPNQTSASVFTVNTTMARSRRSWDHPFRNRHGNSCRP